MDENIVAILTFLCLAGAGIGAMVAHRRLPVAHLLDDTNATVRHVADLFVVMASLVLGLMLNSTSSTFEAVDRNIHAYATDLILLDRTVRAIGPEADEIHRRLVAYVQRVHSEPNVIAGTARPSACWARSGPA